MHGYSVNINGAIYSIKASRPLVAVKRALEAEDKRLQGKVGNVRGDARQIGIVYRRED